MALFLPSPGLALLLPVSFNSDLIWIANMQAIILSALPSWSSREVMDLWSRQKGINPLPGWRGAVPQALDTAHGHPSLLRCEGVKFHSPKAVSVTLKENYSIPERCLGMRDMLKKFKGEGTAPGTFGLCFPSVPWGTGRFFQQALSSCFQFVHC